METIHSRSNDQSRQATGAAANNLDLYQVNCTFFDALGRRGNDYLIARAIQFFAPGIPQVYYVGLLAGTNDMELLARTQVGRDINRHYYTLQNCKTLSRTPSYDTFSISFASAIPILLLQARRMLRLLQPGSGNHVGRQRALGEARRGFRRATSVDLVLRNRRCTGASRRLGVTTRDCPF